MKKERITGIIEYCYNGIPIIRGYCSYKTIIKHSKAHPAYQRQADDVHVKEINAYINSADFKFMPEVVLSYDYSGMFNTKMFETIRKSQPLLTPLDYLLNDSISGHVFLIDKKHRVTIRRNKSSNNAGKVICFEFSEPDLDEVVFNRIDGNHRLEALDIYQGDDFKIPFCIVMISDEISPEKIEMEVFHNINSKAKSLTPIEQYRGLFKLFSVPELESYGKEFSLTKAYLEKNNSLRFSNIADFLIDNEEIILYSIKFFLGRGISVSDDDIADVLSKLEHTYFFENEIIRNCKSKFALVPYIYYCFKGNKQKNAKLDAYNAWFIKNKLYNVKEFDPASMIEVFDSIYDIRKKQVFVAMPFNPELDFVFDAICETVDTINRENKTDLLCPIRIDKQIIGFSYDIVNEILENIKNAGLLIADLTYQNANVYYEVGFAQGLLKSKLGESAEVLYLISNPEKPEEPFASAKFDIQHYKMIPYKNDGNGVSELKQSLKIELEAFYQI